MREELLASLQVPAFTIGVMSDVLERANIDPRPALEILDLDSTTRLPPTGSVSARAELAFERAFLALTPGRADLWAEVGRRHRLPAYGTFGIALSTAPNLREWVKISGKTQDLCFTFTDYRPAERGGKLCGIEFCLAAVPDDLREMTLYRDLGALSACLEEVWRGPMSGFFLEVSASAPEKKVIQHLFRFPVRFDSACTTLNCPSGMTDDPLPYGNRYLHDHYVRQCTAVLDDIAGRDLVSTAIRVMMLQPAKHGTVEAVARRLNMSVRTLQRRLNENSVTFRSLLMRAHVEVAKSHLRRPSLSIAQIAAELGYADRASFDLAFSRWTGLSPRKFRDANL